MANANSEMSYNGLISDARRNLMMARVRAKANHRLVPFFVNIAFIAVDAAYHLQQEQNFNSLRALKQIREQADHMISG